MALVKINLKDIFDSGFSARVVFAPLETPWIKGDWAVVASRTTEVTTNTSGLAEATLLPGRYRVTFPRYTEDVLEIAVPDDDGEYNFALLIDAGGDNIPTPPHWQGPEGPQGPQGEQGPKGDKGDKGDQGDPGQDYVRAHEELTGTVIDLSSGSDIIYYVTLSGAVTYTFDDPANGTIALVSFSNAGGHAVTWPGTVQWMMGVPPPEVLPDGCMITLIVINGVVIGGWA